MIDRALVVVGAFVLVLLCVWALGVIGQWIHHLNQRRVTTRKDPTLYVDAYREERRRAHLQAVTKIGKRR